jgi:hypothetical protein
MNNLNNQSTNLIGDAYKSYLIEDAKTLPNMSKEKMYELGYRLTKEEFINKIKTDNEFAKQWGVIVEVRELSLRERMNLCREKLDDTDDGEILLPSDIEYRMNNYWGIPTKSISLTYNNKTIENYE